MLVLDTKYNPLLLHYAFWRNYCSVTGKGKGWRLHEEKYISIK